MVYRTELLYRIPISLHIFRINRFHIYSLFTQKMTFVRLIWKKQLCTALIFNLLRKSAALYYKAADFTVYFTSISSLKNLTNKFSVGFHYAFRIDGRKIDLRSLQTFVPQALTDNGQVCSYVT